MISSLSALAPFQLTAARRRLEKWRYKIFGSLAFQLTAARRRLVEAVKKNFELSFVSTHSRPKAAGQAASLP